MHPIGTPALLPSFWKRRKSQNPLLDYLTLPQLTGPRIEHSAPADIVTLPALSETEPQAKTSSYLSFPYLTFVVAIRWGREPGGGLLNLPTLSSTLIPPTTVVVSSHSKNLSLVRIVASNNVRNVWGADAGKNCCCTTLCGRSQGQDKAQEG